MLFVICVRHLTEMCSLFYICLCSLYHVYQATKNLAMLFPTDVFCFPKWPVDMAASKILLLLCKGKYGLRSFNNEGLSKMFSARREEVTAEWRELRNEELNDLYYSPNIIWAMCRRMAVTDKKENRGAWWGNLKKGNHMGDIEYRQESNIDTRAWSGFSWLRIQTNVGLVTW